MSKKGRAYERKVTNGSHKKTAGADGTHSPNYASPGTDADGGLYDSKRGVALDWH